MDKAVLKNKRRSVYIHFMIFLEYSSVFLGNFTILGAANR